jgi:hypothetical protein
MTNGVRSELNQQFVAVNKILWKDWDPIGCGVPQDEYDSYVWPVVDLLRKGAPREEVETYLRWAADENMKSPVSEEKLRVVVDKLIALGFGV